MLRNLLEDTDADADIHGTGQRVHPVPDSVADSLLQLGTSPLGPAGGMAEPESRHARAFRH